MSDEIDPLTLVYNGLWDMLEKRTALRELVRIGNRIRFTGPNRSPLKEQVLTADLPEIRIVPTGSSYHHHQTSSSSKITKRFEIQLSTGEQLLDTKLFPIEFEIYRAFTTWLDEIKTLQWKNKTFVVIARLVDSSDGVAEGDLIRGIEGWAALLSCEFDLVFQTTDLKGES